MSNTTYTTGFIKLNAGTVVQGNLFPDYLNPFMPDLNRYKNIVMPYGFDYFGIKRVECFLYNDSAAIFLSGNSLNNNRAWGQSHGATQHLFTVQ